MAAPNTLSSGTISRSDRLVAGSKNSKQDGDRVLFLCESVVRGSYNQDRISWVHVRSTLKCRQLSTFEAREFECSNT
jgi:hypothetical protein